MSNDHPLMQPLRSDSLKPRPSAQAAWTQKESGCTSDITDAPVCCASAISAEMDIDIIKEEVSAVQLPEASLSEVIADVFSISEDSDEDDDEALLQDAVPDHLIPEPACVPLFDQPASERKKRRWLWFVLLLAAAGFLYAAWKGGYLSMILP